MLEQYQTTEDVAVGASLTTILEVTNTKGLPKCKIEVTNTGANAFTDFAVRLKDHALGKWYTLSSGTDWASVSVPWQLKVMDPDPMTLAAGLTTHVELDIGPAYGVQVQAKRTTATTAQVRMLFGE